LFLSNAIGLYQTVEMKWIISDAAKLLDTTRTNGLDKGPHMTFAVSREIRPRSAQYPENGVRCLGANLNELLALSLECEIYASLTLEVIQISSRGTPLSLIATPTSASF
jgi:hypothetical protein